MINPRYGDVWWIQFSPSVGREQLGKRPALIVSHNTFNDLPNNLTMVMPITRRDRNVEHHLAIDPPEGGLDVRSFILTDQLQAADLSRFEYFTGVAHEETMAQVRYFVRLFLLPAKT